VAKISETRFNKLEKSQKIALVRQPNNMKDLHSTQAQCDPHGRMADYDDEQLVSLANAHYIMGGTLNG